MTHRQPQPPNGPFRGFMFAALFSLPVWILIAVAVWYFGFR